MVWLSYVADRLIWGVNPAGFHFTTVLGYVSSNTGSWGIHTSVGKRGRRTGGVSSGDPRH